MSDMHTPSAREVKARRKELEAQLDPKDRATLVRLRNSIIAFLVLTALLLAAIAWRYSISQRAEVADGASEFWAWGGSIGIMLLIGLPMALTAATLLRGSLWAVRSIIKSKLNPLYILAVMAVIVPVGWILCSKNPDLSDYRIWYMIGPVLIAFIAGTFAVREFTQSESEQNDSGSSAIQSAMSALAIAGVLLAAWHILTPLFFSDQFGF